MPDGSQTKSKSESARRLAEECLSEAGGDMMKAEQELLRRFLSDIPLVSEFLRPICRDLVGAVRREVRRNISGTRTSAGLRLLAESWYDWPLSIGGTLGDADYSAVLAEKNAYARLAKQHSIRDDFFGRIHGNMKPGKKVRECLSHDEIGALAKRCGLSREAQ